MMAIAVTLGVVGLTVPRLGRVDSASPEKAALRNIMAIHLAQAQYCSEYGEYADGLQELGRGTASGRRTAASFRKRSAIVKRCEPALEGARGTAETSRIPAELVRTGEEAGYRFHVARSGGQYTIQANPIHCGAGSRRSFFADEEFGIHEHFCPEAATASDPLVR